MSKNTSLYLKDMLESIESIEEYIDGMEFNEFASNRMVKHATIKELEIMEKR